MDQSICYLAAQLVVKEQTASTSLLVRRLNITYQSSMLVMDVLEALNIVAAFSGSKTRTVLIKDKNELLTKILIL